MHIPPDWGIFGALIVSFLVFWFVFGRLFFGPFLKLLSDRERRLKELSDRTQQLLKEENAAVEERESKLAVVRREALARREIERRRAEQQAATMLEQARAQARAELEQLRAELEGEFAAAAGQLEQLAQTLALELAGRVIGRSLANGNAPLNRL